MNDILLEVFDFSDEDWQANRSGYITERQVARLQEQSQRIKKGVSWMVFAQISMTMIVLVLWSYSYLRSGTLRPDILMSLVALITYRVHYAPHSKTILSIAPEGP